MYPAFVGRRSTRPNQCEKTFIDGSRLAALLTVAVAGCASYEPSPVDPVEILTSLREVRLEPDRLGENRASLSSDFDFTDGLTVDEAAAVAVTLNPELQALRAEAGIAAARLVEAGLLPDPSVGWNAVDWIVGGTRDDVLTGFGLTQPIPRPGEISAREGIAQGRIAEVRWAVLRREWRLNREVRQAFLDMLAMQERIALNDEFQVIAARTHDFFARGREVGAATALQENLARLDLAEVQREDSRLQLQLARARQALNALLGLPPDLEYPLQFKEEPFAARPAVPSAVEISDQAVRRRPDLKELLGLYEQSEQGLRLQVARQWPAFSIGTGLELVLPIFSNFNQPAIQTALEVRERVALEVEAAVHELRREAHDAVARLRIARDQVEFFDAEISPHLEESLRLTEQALGLGEATLLEILTAQRQVLDTRQRLLEVRIELGQANAVVAWITGPDESTQ